VKWLKMVPQTYTFPENFLCSEKTYTDQMNLTHVTPADYVEVAELANLAYRGATRDPGWNTEASLIEGPRLTKQQLSEDMVNKPDAHLLLYRDTPEGRLLGTVWLEPTDGDTWYLGLLIIHPEIQNRSLGRTLLAAAEDFALHRGARSVRMTVINVRSILIAWYERRGYTRTGEIQPFPHGDDRFGTPLRDDLVFVVLAKDLVRTSTTA